MRALIRVLSPAKSLLLLTLISSMLTGLFSTLIIKEIQQSLIGDQSFNLVDFSWYFFSMIAAVLSSVSIAKINRDIIHDMRLTLSERILAAPFERVEGLLTPKKGGVLKNHLHRESSTSNYKDCASTTFLNNNSYCFSQHYWAYKWFNKGKAITLHDHDELRINHYYTKSKQEYFMRQNISRGRKISEHDFNTIENRCNKVYDDSILRHLPLNPSV